MKAFYFFLHHFFLVALTASLLSVSSLQAQTFFGSEKLAETPASLEAVVYPLSYRPSTINVIANNQIGGTVCIVIRNVNGEIFFEEYTKNIRYRRHFDLSSLPPGGYSVNFSNQHESCAQAFAFSIDPSGTSRIAMGIPPVKVDTDKREDAKLADNR